MESFVVANKLGNKNEIQQCLNKCNSETACSGWSYGGPDDMSTNCRLYSQILTDLFFKKGLTRDDNYYFGKKDCIFCKFNCTKPY